MGNLLCSRIVKDSDFSLGVARYVVCCVGGMMDVAFSV